MQAGCGGFGLQGSVPGESVQALCAGEIYLVSGLCKFLADCLLAEVCLVVKKTNDSCSPLSNALRQHWLVPRRQFGVVVVPGLWPEAAEQALCSHVSRTLLLTRAFG